MEGRLLNCEIVSTTLVNKNKTCWADRFFGLIFGLFFGLFFGFTFVFWIIFWICETMVFWIYVRFLDYFLDLHKSRETVFFWIYALFWIIFWIYAKVAKPCFFGFTRLFFGFTRKSKKVASHFLNPVVTREPARNVSAHSQSTPRHLWRITLEVGL